MARGPSRSRLAPSYTVVAVPAPPAWHAPAMFAALLVVTLAAYHPAWHGGLLWDDDHHITREALRSAAGLWRIWFDVGATQQYYPIVHSAFWLQWHLWEESTFGYHLVNIVLHALSSGILWLILRRLGVPGAALGAFVFALHPVHVESVAWITELKNTLSGLFVLLAARAYLAFDETRAPRAWALALLLFVLALLAKSVTAILPAALLVVFWWKRGHIDRRRDVTPLVPMFVAGVAAGLMTAWVERTYVGAQGGEFAFTFVERILIAGRVVWFYLGKLLWPAGLIFTYPRWEISQAVGWPYLFPAAALAALFVLWRIRGRSRAPLAAMLLFGGWLFPVLGFFNVYPFRFSFVADHFQYLASIPVIAFVTGALALWTARRGVPANVRAGGAVALVVVLGLLTYRQSGYYADAGTLYREVLRRNPASWMAHGNLGMLMLEERPAEALTHFDASLRLKADVAETRLNRGNALQRLGRVPEAIAEYRAALALDPGMSRAHNNLASALVSIGDAAGALAHASDAVRLQPDYFEAHFHAGRAARALGRLDLAARHLETARGLQPAGPDRIGGELASLHNERGVQLVQQGRIDEGIASLQAAVRLAPQYGDAHFNLANVLQGAGRAPESIPHYQAALEANPADAAAHNNLGSAYESLGRRDDAVRHFREALRLNPASAQARANVARLTGR